MNVTLLAIAAKSQGMNLTTGYAIGAILALFILAYLAFSLIKPEKF